MLSIARHLNHQVASKLVAVALLTNTLINVIMVGKMALQPLSPFERSFLSGWLHELSHVHQSATDQVKEEGTAIRNCLAVEVKGRIY